MTSRLIEVELRVADLERALRFYRDLIGLPFGDIETHEATTPSMPMRRGEIGTSAESF